MNAALDALGVHISEGDYVAYVAGNRRLHIAKYRVVELRPSNVRIQGETGITRCVSSGRLVKLG